MQGYSIGGFLNAVIRRSAKTLLVEGTSDQTLFNRLKRDVGDRLGYEPSGDIDTASMLDDANLAGLGNKAKIQKLLTLLPAAGPARVAIDRKLGVFTDREWDGLNIDMGLVDPWTPPTQADTRFVSVGHSIENYFFRIDGIEAYLKQHFSDHLKQGFFNDLHARFRSMLAFAAVYSFGIRKAGCIGRSDGVLTRKVVAWVPERYQIVPGIVAALTHRGVTIPQNFDVELNQAVDTFLAAHQGIEPARWVCHGHLGEQAIWACVGNLALEHGHTDIIANEIEFGLRDVRFKHSVDHLARSEQSSAPPLQTAVNWLTT